MNPGDERNEFSTGERPQDFDGLLASARAGSREAVAALTERYRPYLLLIANEEWDSDLHAKLGASDLVQESLLVAQHSIADFRGTREEELRGWLRAILANDILEARRRFKGTAKRQADREVPLDPHLRDEWNTPGTEIASQEESAALHAAMSRLPDEYRDVLHLRNWQQLSFAEIGEQMNRSDEAARKLWTRALVQLQSELQPDDGQDD